MNRFAHPAILAALLLATTTSAGADAKRTVSDFLNACSTPDPASQSSCNRTIQINIATSEITPMGADRIACLPASLDFARLRAKLITWLANKPDLLPAREDDGLTSAMTSLYPCR